MPAAPHATPRPVCLPLHASTTISLPRSLPRPAYHSAASGRFLHVWHGALLSYRMAHRAGTACHMGIALNGGTASPTGRASPRWHRAVLPLTAQKVARRKHQTSHLPALSYAHAHALLAPAHAPARLRASSPTHTLPRSTSVLYHFFRPLPLPLPGSGLPPHTVLLHTLRHPPLLPLGRIPAAAWHISPALVYLFARGVPRTEQLIIMRCGYQGVMDFLVASSLYLPTIQARDSRATWITARSRISEAALHAAVCAPALWRRIFALRLAGAYLPHKTRATLPPPCLVLRPRHSPKTLARHYKRCWLVNPVPSSW